MTGKTETAQPKGRGEQIWAKFLQIIPILVAILPLLFSAAKCVYQDHWVMPKIQRFPAKYADSFTLADNYRAVRLQLRGQMITQYKDHVISIVTLSDYYEDEIVIFNGTSGSAPKKNQDYVDRLQSYVFEKILDGLTDICGGESARTIAQDLNVYISLLGSVEYQNQRGNTRNQQCIIGQDNLVQDYDPDKKVIKNRLRYVELELDGRPADMEQDKEIEEIIRDATEKIDARFISKTEKSIWDLLIRHQIPLGWIGLALCLLASICVGWVLSAHIRYRRKCRKSGRTQRPIWKVLCACIIVLFLTENAGSRAIEAITSTEDERLIYETSDIATDWSVDTLFSPRKPKKTAASPVEAISTPEEEWPFSEKLDRLHILPDFIGEDISQRMLEAYEQEFLSIYKNGSKESPKKSVLPDWIDLSSSAYMALDKNTLDEITMWKDICETSPEPSNLYHMERVLTNVVLSTDLKLDFESRFDIAADAVGCGELFLTYRNRNITEEGGVDAEDVALLNGKIYWILGDLVKTGKAPMEYEKYVNCFYMAGLQCVSHGRTQINESNSKYAVLSYYMGNFGERLLRRITEEDSLYNQLGTNAMQGYDKALLALKDTSAEKPYIEDEMVDHIKSGISTLEELGFQSSMPKEN